MLILQESVATGEPGRTFDVRIAPNPTNGLATVYMPDMSGKTTLGLYFSDGSVLSVRTCQSQREELNLSNLPPGCYFLKITGPEGRIIKKIILK